MHRQDRKLFPRKLEELVPVYLPEIPRCPNSDKETYSHGYEVSSTGTQFTLMCTQARIVRDSGLDGMFHQYSSQSGLETLMPRIKHSQR